MSQRATIGLIGLGVMGQNLVLNMQDHGYSVAVYNRTSSTTGEFLKKAGEESRIKGAYSIKELIDQLELPRRILLMVKAGDPVDSLIDQCLPYLEPGDILIDGGNSLFTDTNRRCQRLKEKGIFFIGVGISGGEEGARFGPSLMPGGHKEAWPHLKEIFQSISAKVEEAPCCDWVGEGGAGHYVKMVHNGIEYGDMQLICEAYHILKQLCGLNQEELHEVFTLWNRGELSSYLIEITAQILHTRDEEGNLILDSILDVAGQKGTGKWTVANALDLSMPLSLSSEALFARFLSSLKEERVEASKLLKGPPIRRSIEKAFKDELIDALHQALYCSKIVSYCQGFMLMKQAADEYQWQLDYEKIASLWRGGCIIRSKFLDKIMAAFHQKELKNILLDPYFAHAIAIRQTRWRYLMTQAIEAGIPIPCFSAALSFYDGYRSSQLPTYLLQAQRDFFGAHMYERVDKPRGEFFHTEWSAAPSLSSS